MNIPQISFIVPVYNTEKYIYQCVNSILEQSFQNFEIVLVDDGSRDSCPFICDDYAGKDNRIKVIHQKNKGVSAARNRGIQEASGEFVYFVDSDDWIEQDEISRLYTEAVKTKADVIFTDCYEQYDNGAMKRIHLYSNKFETENKDFIRWIQRSILCHKDNPYYSSGADNAYPAPWSKMIRLRIIKENHLQYDSYVEGIYDDGLFTIETLEYASKIAYSGICTYHYRIVRDSLVHAYRKDMVSRFEKNCEQMDKYIKKYHKTQDFVQAEYCRRIAYLSSFISSYFFHEDNPKSYAETVIELKETFVRTPWKEAISCAQYRNLELKHRYTLYCIRKKIIPGLYIYSKLKRKIKNR